MMKRAGSIKIFSMLFGIMYVVCFYFNLSLFIYYPAYSRFSLTALPFEEAGPAILWYGWILNAAIFSGVVALIVPRSWSERLSPNLSWIVPLVVIVGLLIYERRWFI
jgi:hypothetical protein